MNSMVSLGKHWIVECYDCDYEVINSPDKLEKVFLEAANKSGAHIIDSNFHTFKPHGVSGVIVIEESHFSVHSWPEYHYAAVDIFTCGDSIDIDKAIDVLKTNLKTDEIVLTGDLNRGIVSSNGIERSQSISIKQIDGVMSWEEKFKRSNAWGIATAIDVYDCEPDLIRDEQFIKQYVLDLCEHIEMKRFGDTVVVDFGEDERVAGFSMTQLIETSLVSGHFANASNAAYIDVFSCKYYNPQKAAMFTFDYFNGKKYSMNVCLRK